MKENKLTKLLEKIIYISLGIVLLILPFPRGLFFAKEIVRTQLAIYIIFVLWTIYKIIKKEKMHLNSYLTIGVCILPIAYMLPTFLGYAANTWDAIGYMMRYMAYLLVFLIVSDMTKNELHLKIWLYVIGVSGVLAGLLGIDSLAGGQIGTSLGFSGIGFTEWNRLYGVVQYSNTAGMYYSMTFFILIAIVILSKSKIIKIICSSFMFIMLTALMLTISRGAILLVPVVYVLLLILLPKKEDKIELVLTTITPAIVTLLLYQPLQSASPILSADTGNTSTVWMLTIIAMIIIAVITFLLLMLTNVLNKVSEKTYNITFLSFIGILILAVIIIWFTGFYKKIIPQELLDRFLQTGSQSTSGRTDFYRDGFRVLKDNWLLGAGGGAWNTLYRAYQSYDYGSSEAHNMLLQVWLETGIIGISAYIFVLFSAIKTYIDCLKKKTNVTSCILILTIVVYAVGHSMVDFDFSYFSIPIIVFSLLGALNGITQTIPDKTFVKIKFPAWLGSVVGGSFAIIAVCFIVARGYEAQATSILRDNEITSERLMQANEKMLTAIKYNPWNIDSYVREGIADDVDVQIDLNTLYNMMEQLEPDNKDVLQLHYSTIMRAIDLSPKNPIINVMAAGFMMNKAGNLEEGIKYMENGLKYNPMAYGRYEETANAYYEAGRVYKEMGNKELSDKYLNKAIELENNVIEVNKRALKPVVLTENTLVYIQQSKDLLAQN